MVTQSASFSCFCHLVQLCLSHLVHLLRSPCSAILVTLFSCFSRLVQLYFSHLVHLYFSRLIQLYFGHFVELYFSHLVWLHFSHLVQLLQLDILSEVQTLSAGQCDLSRCFSSVCPYLVKHFSLCLSWRKSIWYYFFYVCDRYYYNVPAQKNMMYDEETEK